MKMKYGLILAAMLATGAMAQMDTNSPPLPEPPPQRSPRTRPV